MNYMFVVGNLDYGVEQFDSEEIATALLSGNIWACSFGTPHHQRMDVGDRCVVYLGGKGKRHFIADFIVASRPEDRKLVGAPVLVRRILKHFPLVMDIEQVNIWERPVPITQLLPDLAFAVDKKNYGLYLRQGCRMLSDNDFEVIITSGRGQ